MIEHIIVISDVKYGKTYKVKYASDTLSQYYTEHTAPADIKDLVNMSTPSETCDRFTYTVKYYYF